jgi:molybdenum cofactor cytidylyltransferase
VDLADYWIKIEEASPDKEWVDHFPNGLVAVTGEETTDQRLVGLGLQTLNKLLSLADRSRFPVLIEADGARLRPLKAPADHEPAIPAGTQQVAVCAGLGAIGKPLTHEWVHRSDRFSQISGIEIGSLITPESIQSVLTSEVGGLKNIPVDADRSVVLTQANTPELQAQAKQVAETLLPCYGRIVICKSIPPENYSTGLGHLDVLAVHERVAAIVLAAGGATRFGQPKQLIEWNGKPFVRHIVEIALKAGLSPVIVVVGAYQEQVCSALDEIPVKIVQNQLWKTGHSTSVKAGVCALPEKTGAALFFLSDQPQVSLPLVRTLVERHQETLAPIIAPLIDGQRGNPVLFDRCTFGDFASLSHEQGGRMLFSRYQVEWVSWQDPGLLLDIDTPDDYQQLLTYYRPEQK